ncbi:hypothetical protein ACLOJK_021427 [Asimina triloba]
MASACVNNIGMSPENFLDCPPSYSSYGWLSPRISFSRDLVDEGPKAAGGEAAPAAAPEVSQEKPDPEASGKDMIDFEFRLHDPVAMLPADELFSDGKLVPLQIASVRPTADRMAEIQSVRSPEAVKLRRRVGISGSDPYVFSPKAPRCSSRWRELLGLKKLQSPKQEPELQKSCSLPVKSHNPKSLKHFLHRHAKSSSVDSSLSLPLLRDTDSESISMSSSRLSLSSSSSSGQDHEDLPRLSLESEKPNQNPHRPRINPPRVKIAKPRAVADPAARVGRSPMRRASDSTAAPMRGVSVDSPRMNSSGRVIFQGLERSSSSPGSFNGGLRGCKNRGMERSYSANVRVTPVLNVPVCSLMGSSKAGSMFGLGQLFSQPKKEGGNSNGARGGGGSGHSRCRNDRI